MNLNGRILFEASLERLPRLMITAVFLGKAAVLLWIGIHGFPRSGVDTVFYLQPAAMYVSTGNFALPSAEGRIPYAQEVYSANAPLYTLVMALVYEIFGFSYFSALWADLSIHLIVTFIFLLLLRRMGVDWFVSVLFVVSSPFLLFERGRPEELAIAFGIVAVIYLLQAGRPRWSLVGVLLGLCIAGHPVTGILAISLVLAVAFRSPIPSMRLRVQNVLSLAFSSSLTVLVSFIPFFLSSPQKAGEQFFYHLFYHQFVSPSEMLAMFPLKSIFLSVGFVVLVIAVVLRRREWISHIRNCGLPIVWRLTFWLIGAVAFLLINRSHMHHYRVVLYVLLILCLVHLFSRAPGTTVPGKGLLASIFVIGILVPNHEIIRYALTPLTWKCGEGVSHGDASRIIHSIIPASASIGGDANLWDMVTDGRPFLAFPYYWGKQLPDYLLSTTFWGFGGKPGLLLNSVTKTLIDRNYEPVYLPPQTGCDIVFLGVRIPVSRSACDWRVSIWRRRDQ